MLGAAKAAAAAAILAVMMFAAGCAGGEPPAVPASTLVPPPTATVTPEPAAAATAVPTAEPAATAEAIPTAPPAAVPTTPEPAKTAPPDAQSRMTVLAELNRLIAQAEAGRQQQETAAPAISAGQGSITAGGAAPPPQPQPGLAPSSAAAAASAMPEPPRIPPEAGGRNNPNDAAFPLMYFQGHGVNPFIDADEDPRSTFSLDGDQASYRIWLNYAAQAAAVPPEAVRTEEFVNAMPQGYANRGIEPNLMLDAMPSEFGTEGYILLRAGYAAGKANAGREPVSIVFVLDASGSMEADNRIKTAVAAIGKIAGMMYANDEAALVAYAGRAAVLQDFTTAPELIYGAAAEVEPGGATYAAAGITAAYRLALGRIAEGREVRIVLLSDGVANVGPSGPDSILDLIAGAALRGTQFTSIGVGTTGNYNDALLEALANRGNGTYHYLTSPEDAERYALNGVKSVFFPSPREARIQVEFNPEAVRKYRLLGYENRAAADEEFREDRLDFGEPGYHKDAAALYEIRLNPDATPDMILATATLRYRPAAAEAHREIQESIVVGEAENNPEEADPYLRLAAAAAQTAELLRRSYYAKCETWDHPTRTLDEIRERLPDIPQIGELQEAMNSYAAVFRPACDRQERTDRTR